MSSVIHAYIATLKAQCKNPDTNEFDNRHVGMICVRPGSFFTLLKDNGEESGTTAMNAFLRIRSYSRYRSIEDNVVRAELSEFRARRSVGRH